MTTTKKKPTKKTILIVDDESPMVEALVLKLSHLGFASRTAYNGNQALDALSDNTVQLVLLDLVMPEKDGFAVLEHLKKNQIKTPVLILTNLGQEEDAARCQSLGAKDYFVKADTPIITIVERIKNILA